MDIGYRHIWNHFFNSWILSKLQLGHCLVLGSDQIGRPSGRVHKLRRPNVIIIIGWEMVPRCKSSDYYNSSQLVVVVIESIQRGTTNDQEEGPLHPAHFHPPIEKEGRKEGSVSHYGRDT